MSDETPIRVGWSSTVILFCITMALSGVSTYVLLISRVQSLEISERSDHDRLMALLLTNAADHDALVTMQADVRYLAERARDKDGRK